MTATMDAPEVQEIQPDDSMFAKPQREHEWLQKIVGEWTYEHEGSCSPGQKFTGTESVRSIGGLWVVGEGQGQMPGGSLHTMLVTLGFDPAKNRYVGTFVGSMMANLWVYEGTLDAEERVLTLECEGPKFFGEGTTRFKDIVEIIDEDHRTLTSQMLDDNGEWQQFMVAHYHRVK